VSFRQACNRLKFLFCGLWEPSCGECWVSVEPERARMSGFEGTHLSRSLFGLFRRLQMLAEIQQLVRHGCRSAGGWRKSHLQAGSSDWRAERTLGFSCESVRCSCSTRFVFRRNDFDVGARGNSL
jgi:hypothetical protein